MFLILQTCNEINRNVQNFVCGSQEVLHECYSAILCPFHDCIVYNKGVILLNACLYCNIINYVFANLIRMQTCVLLVLYLEIKRSIPIIHRFFGQKHRCSTTFHNKPISSKLSRWHWQHKCHKVFNVGNPATFIWCKFQNKFAKYLTLHQRQIYWHDDTVSFIDHSPVIFATDSISMSEREAIHFKIRST